MVHFFYSRIESLFITVVNKNFFTDTSGGGGYFLDTQEEKNELYKKKTKILLLSIKNNLGVKF